MNPVLPFVIAALLAFPLCAQDNAGTTVAAAGSTSALGPITADGVDLNDFVWVARVIAVFADSPNDPAYQQQLRYLAEDPAALAERDVQVITDTDPAAQSAIRQKLRPRGFSLVWVDKDGGVRLRKPAPWTTRELVQAIDKTPLRREEMLQGRPAGR